MFDDAVLAASAEYVWRRGLENARALTRLSLSGPVEICALAELNSLAKARPAAPGAMFRLFLLLAYLRARTVIQDKILDAQLHDLKTRLVPADAVEGSCE